MGLAFFGLTYDIAPQYKLALHNQIIQICLYGNGYIFSEVYNMPIWLRKHTFNEIKKKIEGEREQIESSKLNSDEKTNLVSPDGLINKSEFKKQSKYYK